MAKASTMRSAYESARTRSASYACSVPISPRRKSSHFILSPYHEGGCDIQRMSAGTGVVHSEWNHSKTDRVHFLQIWIVPEKRGLERSYEQRTFEPHELRDRVALVVSRDGRDGSVTIHQDAALYVTKLSEGKAVNHELPAGRRAWVQVVRGSITLNGVTLSQGDGAAATDESRLALRGATDAEVLAFDLA